MVDQSIQYELLVRKLLESRLPSDCPGLLSKVFHNRRYPGKSGHNHQIDVSVEFELAGFSLLFVIECKKYSRKVGIDDVMELAQRVDDIGAHKGVLVTTKGFQEGAIRLARSKGIALVLADECVWVTSMPSMLTAETKTPTLGSMLKVFLEEYYEVKSIDNIPPILFSGLSDRKENSMGSWKPLTFAQNCYGYKPKSDMDREPRFILPLGNCVDTEYPYAIISGPIIPNLYVEEVFDIRTGRYRASDRKRSYEPKIQKFPYPIDLSECLILNGCGVLCLLAMGVYLHGRQ